jgi:ATP synthase protein I
VRFVVRPGTGSFWLARRPPSQGRRCSHYYIDDLAKVATKSAESWRSRTVQLREKTKLWMDLVARQGYKKPMAIKPSPKETWDHLILTMQLGLTFAGSLLFCLFIGYWLDKWLGTKGVFIFIFILLGIAGGGYTVYRQIMDAGIELKDSDKDPPKTD